MDHVPDARPKLRHVYMDVHVDGVVIPSLLICNSRTSQWHKTELSTAATLSRASRKSQASTDGMEATLRDDGSIS